MARGVDPKWGAWHTVAALDSWLAELTRAYPKRKRPDGTIADHRHVPPSGHIPDGDNEVVAADVKPGGMNMQTAIGAFRRDPYGRSKYVIFRRTIWLRSAGWKPLRYLGEYHAHGHFEVYGGARGKIAHPWGLWVPVHTPDPNPRAPGGRVLRLVRPYMRGNDVRYVQRFIGPEWCGPADGRYGPRTERGVRRYQRMRGLPVTGVVEGRTWRHLLGRAGD